MKRLLQGVFAGSLIGLLLPLASYFVVGFARDVGGPPFAIALAGTISLGTAAAWMAVLHAMLPGVDRGKISRGLLTVGVALPILAVTIPYLGSAAGWILFAASAIAAAWGVVELVTAFRGPPRPPALSTSVFRSVFRGFRKAPLLEGSVEGLPITIEYTMSSQGMPGQSRALPVAPPEPGAQLEVGPVTLLGSFASRQRTGDAAFDDAVHVRGRRAVALAVLRAPARAAMLEVIAAGGALSQGSLRGDERVSLALLARAGHALALEVTVSAALRANVGADPAPEVRLGCLEELLVCDLGGEDSREACRVAIRDADPRIRVLGASQLLVGDDAADRQRASDALVASTIGLGAVVAGLLDRAEGTTAEALLRLLAARGGPDAKPALERFIARAASPIRERAEAVLGSVVERAAAGRGRVSLLDTSDAGAVSVAEEGGALSLPTNKIPAR